MQIKITKAKSIDNKPVKAGDVVSVDRATARNLINKGFADAHDAEAKDLNLKTRSVLTFKMQKARVQNTLDAREAYRQEVGEDLRAEIAA